MFHAISNVAPLIGLLGTVLGMIESFEMMSNQESLGRPEMLASGISTALVTTAGGLMVAIPAYLAFMYFIFVVCLFQIPQMMKGKGTKLLQ